MEKRLVASAPPALQATSNQGLELLNENSFDFKKTW